MKLTTLNLQGFESWTDREPKIIDYLQDEQPDVVFFQEAVYLPGSSPYNQVQLLNETLRYPYINTSITRRQAGTTMPVYREGLGCLSRHPITASDTIVLKREADDKHDRIVQLIDVSIGGVAVKFANIHLSITDDQDFATPQLAETLDILRSRNEQRIICGDFNLDNLDDSKDLWRNEYTASTGVPYISFPAQNKRIDYVLLPKQYEFDDIAVSGPELSDHNALTTVINLQP